MSSSRDLEPPANRTSTSASARGRRRGQTAALHDRASSAAFGRAPPGAGVVVYGDVNSTLAGRARRGEARRAGRPRRGRPAQLRPHDARGDQPDRHRRGLATLLFVTAPEGVDNLRARGHRRRTRIHFVGNPMIDTLLAASEPRSTRAAAARALEPARAATRSPRCTARPTSTTRRGRADRDDAARRRRARAVVVAAPPARPRDAGGGRPRRRRPARARRAARLRRLPRAGPAAPALCVTDSGGIQEETTVLGVPCLTAARPNTERPITISHGTNTGWPGARRRSVACATHPVLADGLPPIQPPLWDGHAGGSPRSWRRSARRQASGPPAAGA